MKTRVCLITPGHLSSNPRIVKEADALADAGFDVRVIYGHSFVPAARLDTKIDKSRWATDRVRFGPNRGSRLAHVVEASTRQVARRALRLGYRGGPCAELAHPHPTAALLLTALRRPAALYIAHYVAAIPAAALAAQWHRAHFAFDAEDFHPGDFPDTPNHILENTIISTIESRYLPQASYLTAASPGIGEAYSNRYSLAPATVVLNVFSRALAPVAPTMRGTALPRPSLYWFSQTIGPDRGLECAVRAIALAKTQPHLYLRGIPAPGFAKALSSLAREVSVGDRLHWLDVEPPSEMARCASQYDLGYVGEIGNTLNRRIALTNKQFTYFLGGVPSIMSDVEAHRRFSESAEGAAFLFRKGDPSSLAVRLDELLSSPKRLAAARRRSYALAQERFNWEIERERQVACAKRVLES